MADPVVAKLHAWLAEHQDDLIRDLQSMLQIPSLESEALPNAPFGAENRKALDLALKLSSDAGMPTKDIDGYIGYAETGQGERLIISLGHLDVVPTGPGWKHPEFGAEIEDGYIYARGATDDKGPTMASFYAVKALHAICPDLPARVRQVFGCNEESGFGCVKRYMETEEAPTYGVAPDSGWPVCYAEKGIAGFNVVVPLLSGDFELLEFAGGQRPNIVIDHIIAKVKVSPAVRKHVDSKIADKWDENVYTRWEGDVLEIEANGKAAHGSTPFMGDSAATRAFRFLLDIAPLTEEEKLKELLMITHPSGVGLGIHGREDITKDLTSNVGIAKTANGNLILTINVRYPSTWKGDDLLEMVKKYTSSLVNKVSIEDFGDSTGLYFAVDSPLVKTIIDVYREETGDKAEPFTMGGGTYARAVPNTVSIGTGWLGDGNAHETDERVAIESVYKMSRIYAHILYKLATMP